MWVAVFEGSSIFFETSSTMLAIVEFSLCTLAFAGIYQNVQAKDIYGNLGRSLMREEWLAAKRATLATLATIKQPREQYKPLVAIS